VEIFIVKNEYEISYKCLNSDMNILVCWRPTVGT